LRRELAQHNIRVIALLPSLTDTDMVRDIKLFRWVIPMTPQEVAKAFVAGIQRDAPEILVGWQSHLAVLCQRLAPWLLELILNIATPSAPKRPQPEPKLSFLTRIHRFSDLLGSRT
jgi:3-oxoacyl-[acyl-carrier protein] reductase